MAFGFFGGGKDDADIIYTNCIIHTMDDEMPLADAVACGGGQVLCVGSDEDMQEFVGDDTEVFDLEGMHVYPGFIEANSTPVLDAIDEEVCLVLDESETIDEILEDLKNYAGENFSAGSDNQDDDERENEEMTEDELEESVSVEDDFEDNISEEEIIFGREIIFGYGFDSSLIAGKEPEEQMALLDQACEDIAVLLLSEDGLTPWLNTEALDLLTEAAEEAEIDFPTLPFIMSALSPIDPVSLEESAMQVIRGYCSEGFTTVFEGSAGAYLCSVYEELLMSMIVSDDCRQRFVRGIYICDETDPSYIDRQLQNHKSRYAELSGEITGGPVTFHVSGDTLSEDYLVEAMRTADRRQGRILFLPESEEDVQFCRSVISSYREKGSSKTDVFMIHDEELAQPDTHFEYSPETDDASPAELIRLRTISAAEILGVSDKLGSIAPGKYADFAVFEEDPAITVTASPDTDGDLPEATLTILGGRIIYDCDDDPDSNWELSDDLSENDEWV